MINSNLSAAENAVFQILHKHQGYCFRAEALMTRCGISSIASLRNVMNSLRTKLKDAGLQIISNRNLGYYLTDLDTVVEEPPTPKKKRTSYIVLKTFLMEKKD